MKKQFVSVIAAIAIILPGICVGQSAQEVVDRYFKAIGGKDAWSAIITIRKSSTLKRFDPAAHDSLLSVTRITEIFKRPNKVKLLSQKEDSWPSVILYDGHTMWHKSGIRPADELPQEHAEYLVPVAILGSTDVLLDKTAMVNYKGIEIIDGRNYEVLEVQHKGWLLSHELVFDRETGLLFCGKTPNALNKRITYHESYKLFGNVLFCTQERVTLDGRLESIATIDITVNPEISDAEFDPDN